MSIGTVAVSSQPFQVTQKANTDAVTLVNHGPEVVYLNDKANAVASALPLNDGYGITVYPHTEVWVYVLSGSFSTLTVAERVGPIFAAGV